LVEEFESLRLQCLLEADQISLETGESIGISTRDLIELARVADAASTAIAERAAWSFMTRQELPEDELAAAIDRKKTSTASRKRGRRGRSGTANQRLSRDWRNPRAQP
jgi:hypothetical protein